ncbi:hypothetical protein ACHAWX_004708 [Stephanocyclus meneghinianus]
MVQVEPSQDLVAGELYDDAVFVGSYTCPTTTDPDCPFTCATLKECDACGCFVIDEGGGPWGPAMDVIMCLLPIFFLLGVTLKPNPLPTTTSLPAAAIMMFLIRVMYLGSNPVLCSGAIISGFHEALSPLTIMFGAIVLFETMEATLCMPFMMREMKALTEGHIVAELMLIFSFAYMIEGASGFGTPVALGAPMLASLGHPKLGSVVTLLVMNTFATIWGAAGTPIWFGFRNLGLAEDQFVQVSFKGGVCLTICAYLLLPTSVLTILCPSGVIRQNIIFVLLSLSSVMVPVVGMSFVTYEFPALIGGMIGCVVTAGLIRMRLGLKEYKKDDATEGRHLKISTTSENSIVRSIAKARDVASMQVNDVVYGDLEAIDNVTDKEDVKENAENKNGNQDDGQNGIVDQLGNYEGKGIGPGPETRQQDQQENTERSYIKSITSHLNHDSRMDDAENLANLSDVDQALGPRKSGPAYYRELLGRTCPLWGTVLLLIVTRVQQIGLKDLLLKREPYFQIDFGTYGIFRLSASLVFQLIDILTHPDLSWKYELLYVPFIIPFVLMSLITMVLYRRDLQASPKAIFGTCLGRLKKPAVALLGALALVQLMIKEGAAAPADIIGSNLSQALREGWIVFTALIGTLGSFFSGSTTISNLTFGGIQEIAAESIGTSVTSMLALQAVGASAGNGVCLNNIIAACTVVGLNVSEGKIIAKTFKPVLGMCVLATVTMLAFFFRF